MNSAQLTYSLSVTYIIHRIAGEHFNHQTPLIDRSLTSDSSDRMPTLVFTGLSNASLLWGKKTSVQIEKTPVLIEKTPVSSEKTCIKLNKRVRERGKECGRGKY